MLKELWQQGFIYILLTFSLLFAWTLQTFSQVLLSIFITFCWYFYCCYGDDAQANAGEYGGGSFGDCYYLAVLSQWKRTLISKEAARHGAIVHVVQKNKTV